MHSKGNGELGYRTWARLTLPSSRRTRTHTAKQFTTLFPALAPQFPDVLTLTSGEVVAAASPSAVYALRALTRIDSAEVAIGLIRIVADITHNIAVKSTETPSFPNG
jgi:hypothetical protein